VTGSFPGATGVTRLRVYDWPTPDGLRGGSPHLHTVSSEAYVVLAGSGTVQTLSGAGYEEHALQAGTVLWFTPGTVHRLVNDGDLDILVVMQNSGLPEAGDAVMTFPLPILRDRDAYARAAALEPPEAGAAQRRRDLAIEGYLQLRERVVAEGPGALDALYEAAAGLVRGRIDAWRRLWQVRALAQAYRTGEQLDALAAGRPDHLADSSVHTGLPAPEPARYGMCGRLSTWTL
jgi:mannose-6-phosphate isomerase-like protein (cupin superfamily)